MNQGARYGVIASLLWFQLRLSIPLILLILFALYTVNGGYKFLYIFARTCRRDFKALYAYIKIFLTLKRFERNNWTVPMVFEQNVEKHPDKVCYAFEDQKWTFRQISQLSNRVANVFDQLGLKRGDAVALLMDSRPEYAAIFLGLSKLGVVAALINHNLRDKPLAHCIKIADSKAVIFGAEFSDAVASIRDQLDPSVKLYAFDTKKATANNSFPKGTVNLDDALADASTKPLTGPQRCGYMDKMLYIYTSGTTGLPKAAIIKHARYFFIATGVFHACGVRKDDIFYVHLPMYHMTGAVMGSGMAFLFGAGVALRKKFSASNFWTDCIRYGCTVSHYLGEINRFLLAAPSRPEERAHKVRLMLGSGLRPQIWEEFVRRFNIESIAEIYGATEGNANIVNVDQKVGAVGFVSLIAPSFYPVAVIKVTDDEGEPIRGPDGLCIRCGPGEQGMFVSKIAAGHPLRDFAGYVDSAASSKKVARDVFAKGDAFFLSGDILVVDELGYLYFKDRIGDTFRWKGENVSTAEVEAVVSNVAGLKDVCVYGVEVPGCEGRAGMAAILDPEKTLNLDALAKELAQVLPAYARPLFVRLVSVLDMTGTYKLKKSELQKEAFDPAKTGKDAVYLLDPSSGTFVPFVGAVQEQFMSGKMRL